MPVASIASILSARFRDTAMEPFKNKNISLTWKYKQSVIWSKEKQWCS